MTRESGEELDTPLCSVAYVAEIEITYRWGPPRRRAPRACSCLYYYVHYPTSRFHARGAFKSSGCVGFIYTGGKYEENSVIKMRLNVLVLERALWDMSLFQSCRELLIKKSERDSHAGTTTRQQVLRHRLPCLLSRCAGVVLPLNAASRPPLLRQARPLPPRDAARFYVVSSHIHCTSHHPSSNR